jgi:phosphoribosylformylglycinamidine (FGAM) synthase-like amidotransferase family enzyme
MRRTVNILYFPGTNCHRETESAFRQAGAICNVITLSDLLSGRSQLDSADILCLPGGFSFGDHLGAGRVAALSLRRPLHDTFERCRRRPILGICNGFQILVAAGAFGDSVALVSNESGMFVDRPEQDHIVTDDLSPWFSGMAGTSLVFPCAHAEGRLIFESEDGWTEALSYPSGRNPDGSYNNIAGITSDDGLTLGLMDHPERSLPDAPCRQMFRNVLSMF